MKDYLREFCADLNIQLMYIEDDYTALAGGIKGGKPFIKVDSLFNGCPEKVAKAIMSYCTESQHKDTHLEMIKNYIFESVITVNYKIEPPDEKFTSLFIKHAETVPHSEILLSEDKISENGTDKARTPKSKAIKETTKKTTTRSRTSKSKTPGSETDLTDASSLVEMDISSITRKGFHGGFTSMKPDETIKPSADDVIELDIEIYDPNK